MHPTRIFKTPEELEKAFNEYKESLKEVSKEWVKVQYVGKDGEKKTDYPKIPLTIEGFKIYCRKHYGCVNDYFLNTGSYYDDFSTICTYIKEEIRNDQILGGLLGFHNPSITQRLNGLTDKTETNTTTTIKLFNIDPLTE